MGETQDLIAECAVCATGEPRALCRGAFLRRGIVKVHWECWSACNLSCRFCYRTQGKPLETAKAESMLAAISASGAASVVFAGGDPTLRRDLPHLVRRATVLGLKVEVQTNAHHLPGGTLACLTGPETALIGVSLDGATPDSHDRLRSTRGNFNRVLQFLDICRGTGKPVIVRTMVNLLNLEELPAIGRIVARYNNVARWSLLEFTPVGDGYVNASTFQTTREQYLRAADEAAASFCGSARVDVYRGEAKAGTYALVTPDGQLYGTVAPIDGHYRIVGSMLANHLDTLAAQLPFDAKNHRERYGSGLAPELPLD